MIVQKFKCDNSVILLLNNLRQHINKNVHAVYVYLLDLPP